MFSEKYEQLKQTVEENLLSFLPETDPESRILYDAMKYSLEAGGKRIRPVLLLASSLAAGGSIQESLPFACALEMIHTYSLIHDDHPSMDDDDLRRGRPTNHRVFGNDMAILAGDGLLNSAMDVMFDSIEECEPGSELLFRRIRAARELSRAAGVRGMIAGQTADVRPGKIEGGEAHKLLYIHRNKTGALIRSSVRAGAVLGGAGPEMLKQFALYGEQIGVAFQIVDDILDVVGDEEELGKHTGMDEARGKRTYPALYGLEKSGEKAAEATEAACQAIAELSVRRDSGEAGGLSGPEEWFDFLSDMALDLLNRIS